MSTQTYATHRRWSPVHHFFAAPLSYAAFLWTAYRFTAHPTVETALMALIGLALAASVLAARGQALTVQNRLIRLEMTLRLSRVLPPDLVAKAGELRTRQLIALRFASDAELPDLTRRTLAGEFESANDIKRAITSWVPDHLRA